MPCWPSFRERQQGFVLGLALGPGLGLGLGLVLGVASAPSLRFRARRVRRISLKLHAVEGSRSPISASIRETPAQMNFDPERAPRSTESLVDHRSAKSPRADNTRDRISCPAMTAARRGLAPHTARRAKPCRSRSPTLFHVATPVLKISCSTLSLRFHLCRAAPSRLIRRRHHDRPGSALVAALEC